MNERKVYIGRTTPETLVNDVETLIAKFGAFFLDKYLPILIKINGNYYRDYPGSNTSKWFLDALLKALIRNEYRNIKVIEGDLPYFTASQMIKRTGLKDVINANKVNFLPYEYLSRDKNELPTLLKEAQLINVPVFHSHAIAVMSCATKNLFGLLPKTRRKYHSTLSEKLLELYQNVKSFTLVDGTVGLAGESTRRGIPQRLDLILAGLDTLAIDFVVAKIMDFSPYQIPLLKVAMERGMLETKEIKIEGEFSWESLPHYNFNFDVSMPRRIIMSLESSFLESWSVFRWWETRLEWMYHNYSYFIKKKQLFDGPWMEYEKEHKS